MILTNIQNVYFLKEQHGTGNEKVHDPLIFCEDQIGVITNFAIITNAVIKRVHCTMKQLWMDDLRFYVLFNSISVISGPFAPPGTEPDNEKNLCLLTQYICTSALSANCA